MQQKTIFNGRYLPLIWAIIFIWNLYFAILDNKGEYSVLLIFCSLLFVYMISYCVKEFESRIFLFCFLIAFFTFLLGGEILDRIANVFELTFAPEIHLHTDICLAISLVGLFAGYRISEEFSKRYRLVTPLRINFRETDYHGDYARAVRKFSKVFFFATYLFWMLVLWRQVSYVRSFGYMAYYVRYSSGLPQIFHTISDMCPVGLFIFLSTMPSKREAMLPILLYGIHCVLSLGTGRRLYFMVGILLIFAYAVCRNKYSPDGETWVSKKMLLGVLIAIPFLLAGMYLFEYIRSDTYVGNANDYNPIFGFFARQGISVNVIKFAEKFKNSMNEGAHYSLYNLTKFLQTNLFNKYLLHHDFGYIKAGQTIENALQSNSLANFISYYVSNTNYLNGIGLGSCYIAELYVDFGYFGVMIGNLIYGFILHSLFDNALKKKSIWLLTLGLFVLDILLRANRSTFDAFLADPLYLTFWGTLILIHLLAKYSIRRQFSQRRVQYLKRTY